MKDHGTEIWNMEKDLWNTKMETHTMDSGSLTKYMIQYLCNGWQWRDHLIIKATRTYPKMIANMYFHLYKETTSQIAHTGGHYYRQVSLYKETTSLKRPPKGGDTIGRRLTVRLYRFDQQSQFWFCIHTYLTNLYYYYSYLLLHYIIIITTL